MLRKISPPKNYPGMEIPVGEANLSALFPSKLEFNPASHGTWNIVHIGMNLPESHQIYVCATNCMRGVVLTAAEMNCQDRFSFVLLKEEDMLEGTVEDITIQGTMDVIHRLPKRPPVVILFTVCTHHFLGCDLDRIYRELEQEFPDIDFIRGYMDPILQKESPSPDMKLRRDMYDVVPKLPLKKGHVAVIGHNVSLDLTADLYSWIDMMGGSCQEMTECQDYEEYKSLGHAEVFVSGVPNGRGAIEKLARRLDRKCMYIPMCFSYEEISNHYYGLKKMLLGEEEGAATSEDEEYIRGQIQTCEREADLTRTFLQNAPIMIDYTVHPRPLGLARYLLEHGFCVEKIYLNGISPEEQGDAAWLRDHHPDLLLCSTILPPARVLSRDYKRKVLAIGQQAAWFNSSPYFVNMVEGGGLQGFDGIRGMLEFMRDAWMYEKDTRDLVPRKGLGCESCI